jgi:hypothetical protein
MTGFNTKKTMANDKLTVGDLKSDSMASSISHAENSIIEVLQDIEQFGSEYQKVLASGSLEQLEKLYMSLRNDDE